MILDIFWDLQGTDSIYGDFTWKVVKQFKADQHLVWEQMGDVGPGTIGRLDELFQSGGSVIPVCSEEQESTTAFLQTNSSTNIGNSIFDKTLKPKKSCSLNENAYKAT